MEALKLKLFAVVLVAFLAIINKAAAADAPAPSPTSDVTVFAPTLFASFTALLLGYFFCWRILHLFNISLMGFLSLKEMKMMCSEMGWIFLFFLLFCWFFIIFFNLFSRRECDWCVKTIWEILYHLWLLVVLKGMVLFYVWFILDC